jgi:tRNA(fMet)-specific endonuclease VapC
MQYMMDTHICIFVIRQKKPDAIKQITRQRPEDLLISSITVSELEYGCEKSADPHKNRLALMEFLSPFSILPFDPLAAQHYGKLRAQLERDGTPVGAMDMLIAAHARSVNATLVTNNTRDFKRIKGLNLADWS